MRGSSEQHEAYLETQASAISEMRTALEEVLANCRDLAAKCRFCGCSDARPHFSICPIPKVMTALKSDLAATIRANTLKSEGE